MKGPQRAAAILVAVFFLLAAVVYWGEFRRSEPEPEPRYAPLWELAAGRIVGITVQGHAGVTYRMERDNYGVWRVVSPYYSQAEQRRVQRLADYLSGLQSYRRFSPEEIDLEAFGLITPTARIVVTLSDGEERTLLVGAESPKGNTYYVHWQGEVHLCPRGPIGSLLSVLEDPPLPPTPFPTATPTAVPTATPIGLATPGSSPSSRRTP